jgi:hypothetical protein
MEKILKYPRTAHVESSQLQKGDHDLTQVRFDDIRGSHLVIEEKMDGANAGVSFDGAGKMWLQSRGHYLVGGPRERHWDLFKQWAAVNEQTLLSILEDRYIMYGEWMYAKHTVFYDLLPHYFLEFDIYDRLTQSFLSTVERRKLLARSPIVSVKVLHEGPVATLDDLKKLATCSYFKSGLWRVNLIAAGLSAGVDPDTIVRQTDGYDLMEGLYIKVEEGPAVKQRLKWVRNSFTNSILDSDTHWLDRPIVPNRLAPGIDIF